MTGRYKISKLKLVRRVKKRAKFAGLILLISFLPGFQINTASAETFAVSTLSGRGGGGVFQQPFGVGIAPDGTIYVADKGHFKIKKIVKEVISDFASIATKSLVAMDESFCSIYVKNSDEIFASDCQNSKVFKYNKLGTLLRTYQSNIGLPKLGHDWGGGLAVDNLGGIFLSDEYNHVIIRIDQISGASSIYAGLAGKNSGIDGDFKTATFNLPRGLAVDSKNNLFVADFWSSSIRKITPARLTTTVQNGLGCVSGVSIDSNDVVYTVNERYCPATIFKVGTGKILEDSKAFKSGIPGYAGKPIFNAMSGMSIDRYGDNPTNNIYIVDHTNHSIKVFSNLGKLIKTIGSEDSFGISYSEVENPLYDYPIQTFPLDDGSFLVTDNFTIRHLSGEGNILKTTHFPETCWYSHGVAFTPDGTFFCTDGNKIRVRFIDGTWTTIGSNVAGQRDGISTDARFDKPEGLATFKNELFLADAGNRQIRKISRISGTKDFAVTTVLGTGIWTSAPDIQPRAKATFAGPTKIVIDGVGNLYIADGGVDSIFKTSLTQETDVTRIARGLGSWPSSMSIDKQGRVYISTWDGTFFRIENNTMRKIGGNVGFGNLDGSLESAYFSNPTGLSIDLNGNLIVADRDNQKIRKIGVGNTPGLNIFSTTTLSS